MLNFWYSERCTREIKLVTAISVCAIIYYCSGLAKLSVTWTLVSLAIGVVTHLLQLLGAKFAQSRPDAQRLNLFLTAVPVFAPPASARPGGGCCHRRRGAPGQRQAGGWAALTLPARGLAGRVAGCR